MNEKRCNNCNIEFEYELNKVIHRGYHKLFCDECFGAYENHQLRLEKGEIDEMGRELK